MKFQRLFSILLCVCLAIACCTSAFAESPHFDSSAPSEYLTDIVDNSRISPRGSNPPPSSKVWDWGNGIVRTSVCKDAFSQAICLLATPPIQLAHPLNVLTKPTKVFPFMSINKMEAPSHLAGIQTVWRLH